MTLKKAQPIPSTSKNNGPEIITFGCRLNIVESEQISQNLTDSKIASDEKMAIFNTCSVTNEAEKQARQAIRKYHRQHPNSQIIVTGCAAQSNPDQFVKMPEVTKILGNREKLSASNFSKNATTRRVLVSDIMQHQEEETTILRNFVGKSICQLPFFLNFRA